MRLRIHNRIGLVFLAILATLLAVLATNLWAYQVARQENAVRMAVQIPSIEAAQQLLAEADHLYTDGLVYPWDAPHRAEILRKFDFHQRSFQASLKTLEAHADTGQERALLSEIQTNFAALLAIDRRMRTHVSEGEPERARRLHEAEAGRHFAAIARSTSSLHDINMVQAREVTTRSLARFDQAGTASIVLTIVGVLIAAGLWRLTTQDVVAPLERLSEATDAIAEGRFVTVSDGRALRTRELAALQTNFNRMSDRLKEASEALQQHNQQLETQVAERTAALSNANRQLRTMVDELETLDRLKSDFMAVMSHELLTPINFIVGFGSALEDELLGPLNPKQTDAVGKLLGGAERLTRMVRNTLEYTQLEAGRLEVLVQETELGPLLAGLSDEWAALLAAKCQRLALDVPAELPRMVLDPDRLRQVLFELLDNAAKFSLTGSEIGLRVSVTSDHVTLEVSDAGAGIDEASQQRLFEPFYQVNAGRTREHGGMGLGLPLSQHLVNLMGGTLSIHSALGRGTRVTCRFPVQVAGVPAHRTSARDGSSEISKPG